VHPSDLIARLRAPVPHHTSLLAPDR
jgi:hypothetical protein